MITKEALQKLKEQSANRGFEGAELDEEFSPEAFDKAKEVSMKLILDKNKMDKFRKLLAKYGPNSKELASFIMDEMAEATKNIGGKSPIYTVDLSKNEEDTT